MSGTVAMTALIVSRNEAHFLGDRLRELAFCNERIVVDLGSKDETRAVAEAAGARVIAHPPTAIVEEVHCDVVEQASNDLILIPDPDEAIPPGLASQLAGMPDSLDSEVAVVVVPRIYYFRDQPLCGTIWGGVGWKALLIRRSGTRFQPAVHHGIEPRDGYRSERVAWDGENALVHHWVNGYGDFLTKHVRYLRAEGTARMMIGEITGVRGVLSTPWRAFRESYVERDGRRDGIRGLNLSVLYALYRTGAEIQLLRALRRTAADEND